MGLRHARSPAAPPGPVYPGSRRSVRKSAGRRIAPGLLQLELNDIKAPLVAENGVEADAAQEGAGADRPGRFRCW